MTLQGLRLPRRLRRRHRLHAARRGASPTSRAALPPGARYVIGTTGWDAQLADVRARWSTQAKGGVVHAANFSLGVNLFYKVVRDAAPLFARFPDYDPYVLEQHHRQKKDAPSGTARALARILEAAPGPRKKGITGFEGAIPDDAFHVAAVRAGGIVGEHTVGFDSGGDEILLEHRARTRRGFALGAVLAAEWIANRYRPPHASRRSWTTWPSRAAAPSRPDGSRPARSPSVNRSIELLSFLGSAGRAPAPARG